MYSVCLKTLQYYDLNRGCCHLHPTSKANSYVKPHHPPFGWKTAGSMWIYDDHTGSGFQILCHLPDLILAYVLPLSPLFTFLQLWWHCLCSSTKPNLFPPQGLCTSCPLHLECSFWRPVSGHLLFTIHVSMQMSPSWKGLRHLTHPGHLFFSLSLLKLLFIRAKACLLSALPCIGHKSFASLLGAARHLVHTTTTMPCEAHSTPPPSAMDQPVACPEFLPLPNVREARGTQHGIWLPEWPSERQSAQRIGCPEKLTLHGANWDKWETGSECRRVSRWIISPFLLPGTTLKAGFFSCAIQPSPVASGCISWATSLVSPQLVIKWKVNMLTRHPHPYSPRFLPLIPTALGLHLPNETWAF